MTSLENAVPEFDADQEALLAGTRAMLGQIPLLGPIAVETVSVELSRRVHERRQDFDKMLVEEIRRVTRLAESHDAAIAFIGTDEFLSHVARARRLADDTASDEKRRRLAAATANNGPWSGIEAFERGQFARLVDEFDDLHIWLVWFFQSPYARLNEMGRLRQVAITRDSGADMLDVIGIALNSSDRDWRETVLQAVDDLNRNRLSAIPVGQVPVANTASGLLELLAFRTTSKGERFLKFVAFEPEQRPGHGLSA